MAVLWAMNHPTDLSLKNSAICKESFFDKPVM